MGEDAIEAGNRGSSTVIGTYGGWLNCSQCGNCIEVCPTGTLLDGVYRHATRPWELDQTITTDVYSSDGMQLSIGSRSGEVHRIVARDRYVNGLNGEFLDVKARFAHEFINHPDRIKTPLIRYSKGGKLMPATWDDAVKFVVDKFAEHKGSVGVVASPRLTNESIFTLGEFANEVLNTKNVAIADKHDISSFFAYLSVPLATHNDIRYASSILLVGGEPEEEQTYTAKQVRQAVKNGGAKLIVVNDTPIRLTTRATQFVHVNRGSIDAFALTAVDPSLDADTAKAMGIDANEIDAVRKIIFETQGDVIVMVGAELSSDAHAVLAANASSLSGEGRRILLHPLALYNNSVGAIDMLPGARTVAEVVKNSKAVLIAGSLQDASILNSKEFVVVQELFETGTTDHADVVLPVASFAEVDGTFTNNAGNVQRVRKAIDPVHRSKPDWMITALIAKAMGADLGEMSASAIFRSIADSIPAYSGLRYPMLKDESNPVQVKYPIANGDVGTNVDNLKRSLESFDGGEKNYQMPQVGHKLHRLTTMTSKTPQFHLLANGNPKPENLLVAPLAQFELDGTPRKDEEAMAVTAADRANPGGR